MGNVSSSPSQESGDEEPIPGASSSCSSSFASEDNPLLESPSLVFGTPSLPISSFDNAQSNLRNEFVGSVGDEINRGTSTAAAMDKCWPRLPFFQKKLNPLRLLDDQDHPIGSADALIRASKYTIRIQGDDEDTKNTKMHRQEQCCYSGRSTTPSKGGKSRRRSRMLAIRSDDETFTTSTRSLTNREEDELDERHANNKLNGCDNYADNDSEDDNDYNGCAPYPSRAANDNAPSSDGDTSPSSFYYCYPSNDGTTGSSFSKCAGDGSGSGLPLFMDYSGGSSVNDWTYTQDELDMLDGDEPTEASNLQDPRKYWIVTTAALPWMTGTAINPLLRAAYLSQRNRQLLSKQERRASAVATSPSSTDSTVTLVLPWLENHQDREQLYGPAWAAPNKTPDDQEAYIRTWLATSAHLPLEAAPPSEGGIAIEWYPARYHAALSSIFALGDLCEMIPLCSTDDALQGTEKEVLLSTDDRKNKMICILEEPEHVNFYRAPGRESWRDKFDHVIGIIHTNYKAYARSHYSGIFTGPLVGALSSLMVRAYCDKVVKLSPVLQTYAPDKEVVSNVHGIRQEFFNLPLSDVSNKTTGARCYFIGKLLWAKGLDKLLELETHFKKKTGQYFEIDIVGTGPEQAEIERSFLGKQRKHMHEKKSTVKSSTSEIQHSRDHWRYFRQPIPANFLGRHDHAEVGPQYNIFINPSITEVLCTTTAEAIAMGKWVIIPRHASNEFFLQFSNCLQYSSKGEFVELLQYTMANPAQILTEGAQSSSYTRCNTKEDRSHLYAPLTWEAATERLIDSAYLSKREERRRDRLTLHKEDRSIQEWHYALGNGKSGDVLRKVLGGGPVAEQSTYKRLSSSNLSASSSSLSLVSAV